MQELVNRYPVTLYTVTDCDACDLVRMQLQNRDVPYTEKDSATDVEVQTELKAKAGTLSVPTVTIGNQVLSGYNKMALDNALDEVGYLSPTRPSDEEE
jgi:glutaredoxin